ncbi:MAG: ABC transporter substrate-binding protein [Desulfovibrio sp.]|nr:ABC transporter substrate-binding protein [Desulfovibrio sp.]
MKRLLPSFVVALLLACLVSAASAQPAQEARAALDGAVSRILAVIRNPEYANPATRPPLRRQIEAEVRQIFDFGEFSSRTVGPRWKTFNEAQKQAFSNAFADLLLNTYLNRITGYNGETVSYTGETVSPEGDKVEVRTAIAMKDGKKIPVSYRMLNKNGKWRVYDVIIENISLVKNYRTQFQDILNTATPEQLIERVRAKAAEILSQGQKAQ